MLCEAAGFDVIFIETVGVGQSETAVHSMVDLFMLLQISGAGDELQGIKRGIMEMADLMVITKADGENIHKAELAQTQFQGALRLFPVPESGWRPKVYTSSAVARTGLEEVWKGVEEYLDHIQKNGYFQHNRNRQNKYWMYESINEARAEVSTATRPWRRASERTRNACWRTKSRRSSPPRSCWRSISRTPGRWNDPCHSPAGGLPAGGYAHNTALIIVKISSHETRTLLPGCGDIAARFRL